MDICCSNLTIKTTNMQKLIHKLILILVMSFITKTLYAQNTKTIQTNVGFGRNLQDCRHPGSFCGMQTNTNKTTANSQITYNNKTNELTITILKSKTEKQELIKLKTNQLEKGIYLYSVLDDFMLPKEILKQLGIKNKTKIVKGDYLVKDKGNVFEIVVKLE